MGTSTIKVYYADQGFGFITSDAASPSKLTRHLEKPVKIERPALTSD